MTDPLKAGLSGLQVASMRVATAAHNTANVLTNGFRPSHVVAEEMAGGGVRGKIVKDESRQEPARDDASELGSLDDLVDDTTTRILAAAAFRANLKNIQAADDMTGTLIDMVVEAPH